MNTTAMILERPDMLESIRSETLQSVTTFLELEGLLGNSFVIQGGYFQLPEGPTTFSFQTARLASSLAGHLACLPRGRLGNVDPLGE